MTLVGHPRDLAIVIGTKDDGLAGISDVMPMLLDCSCVEKPVSCDGKSMIRETSCSLMYGDLGDSDGAWRMMSEGRLKLVYFPIGNARHCFYLQAGSTECTDLVAPPAHKAVLERPTPALVERMNGSNAAYLGGLVGLQNKPANARVNRDLSSQRRASLAVPGPRRYRQLLTSA